MKILVCLFLIFLLLTAQIQAGPIVCTVCVTSCSAGCAFSLFFAPACIYACVVHVCGVPCLLPTP